MNISAISSYRNYNNYSANAKKVNFTSFKGGLGDSAANRVLNMLRPKVTATKMGSGEVLKSIMDSLATKWKRSSIGMMVIPENDLAGFVGKEAANIKDVQGVCVAVGDKFGPIETWGNCFEAITVLLPKLFLHR